MKINKGYKITIILFLILNLILMARMLELIYLPGETTSLEKSKQAAQSVIKYCEELAKSYGVSDKKAVKDILAKFIYEIEKGNSPEEVASLMVDYGRQVQNTIFRELQDKRVSKILGIVNSQKLPQQGNITISNIKGNMKFVDPQHILTTETKKKLKNVSFNKTIELKIKNNQAKFLSTGKLFNQVDFLQTKVASLERQLSQLKQKAGFASLTGSGIIIKVFDENDKLEESGIVHDSDLRDIINELLIAGARGIEVGGQRLIATSSIRCVGPTILVNNKPISVNPVVIKAVGDPEVLKSSLDIVQKQLQPFGIELKINSKTRINLSQLK